MKLSSKLIRHSFHTLIYIVVSFLVLAAIFLSVARLVLPVIEDYKSDIEARVSELVGQQVEIATLDAAWYGLEPQLVLKGVQLLSKDRTESFGYFQQARIGLNIIGSIFEWRFKPGALTIEGASLVIVRENDGNISISGFEKGAPKKTSTNNQAISDWLFNQRLLDVKDSELVWLDMKNGEEIWRFSKVNLRFRNDGDHHLIHGSVSLPEELGARLEVAMDVNGDLLSARGWSGNAYVEGSNLKLERWLKKASLSKASISNAMVGMRLWGQWRKAELTSLKGEVFSNGFQLSVKNEPKIQAIESLSSNILIQRMNDSWEATFDDIVISTSKTVWPQSRVDVKFDPKRSALDANISYVDIHDVLPVVKLFTQEDSTASKLLSRMNPSGAVNDLKISLNDFNNEKQKPQIYVAGEFSQVSHLPWKKIPGVKNLKGYFEFNNGNFSLNIPRQDFTLNYSGVFAYPARLNNVTASVLGKSDSSGLTLSAKVDHAEYRGASTYGSLEFNLPAAHDLDVKPGANTDLGTGPRLDLAFYFKDGLVNNARYYIPSRIMNPKAVDWITRSLLGGKVNSGGLLYYGSTKKFPFLKNEGLFDLTLDINDGRLAFAEGWPKITKINGEFNLFANGLSFFGKTAESLGNKLSNVDLVFPEFRTDDRKLIISGDIAGKSEDKINYLHKSPLETIFAKNISPLKLSGKSDLHLELDISLADVKKTKASGVVNIHDNHLVAKEWKLDVENVFTKLRFDNQGIYAEKFTGLMGDVSLNGDINTLNVNVEDVNEAYRNIVITGDGDVNEKQIGDLLGRFIDKAHWARYLTGNTNLKTTIKIPILFSNKNVSKKINLSLASKLDNVSLSLPYPLEKQLGNLDDFNLVAELSGEKRYLNIETNKINALFEMVPAGNTQAIVRGGIGFEQKAELPSENGYRFLGHLDQFSWSDWEPIIFPPEDEIPLLAGDGASGSQYFNVDVDKFEIFGIWFGKTAVQASSGAQLWSIHLSGDEVAGEIFIPVVLSSAPLVMNMDKLIVELTKKDEGSEQEENVYIDPRKLPEIKVNSKIFILDKRNFGSLNALATKIENGLHLDQFSMKTKYTDITANGDWLERDGKQTSTFDILVKTSHLGKTIKSWGFKDAFGSGTGDIRINANWLGKPSDFSFEIASGSMDVDIKDSSLLDFQLGAAKMAGLFLPRRLLLDFRDVFSKGMHFDSIKGQYQIENGNAYTTKLNLDGPSADILMAGRIGLVAEDYDQLVTVNRRLVGDSISTLAALAANPLVNPILAAQVYALKKLFEKQIDDMLTVQYTIKGPWEDPKITPVVKNLKDRGEQIDDLFE